MTVKRSIPSSLAAVLSELELERPTIVTRALIEGTLATSHHGNPPSTTDAINRLRTLGWLLPLRVRDAWEFAPADRAGPLPGGDPFIELRAINEVRPDLHVGIALESAAFLRSLASRQPTREVLIFDEGSPPVRALDTFRRVNLTLPRVAYTNISGLAVQTPTAILATIAIRPTAFRDWPGLPEWLGKAAAEDDGQVMVHLLSGRPSAAWARAAYLMKRSGNPRASAALLSARPPGEGPFYLGPRRKGPHDKDTDVIDSVIDRYSESPQESS